MHASPLLHGSIRHPLADIVLVEGELEATPDNERLLIAPYHFHHTDEEIFYVLTGQVGFEIRNEEFIANAGDAVLVPPGEIHTWWNASSTPSRYLIAMPKRLDDLILAIHASPLSPNEMAQVFTDHDSTLLGWTR